MAKKPARTAGPRETDLWNDDDGDSWYSEDADVDEDTDDDDEDDELDDDGDTGTDDEDDNEDDLDPALTKRLGKEREALYAQIVKEIAEGSTDSPIHKGLQRHISARDKTIADQTKAMAAMAAELLRLKGQVDGVSEGVEWTGQKLIENLDPEVQDKLKGELSERVRSREVKELKEQLQGIQNAGRQGVIDDPQQAAIQQALDRRKAFIEENQRLAKAMGVDATKLDYGSDEDGVVEMQKKFSESLMKAIGKKSDRELDGVTRKRSVPATRTSGGGSAGWSGKSAAELLELGASQRMPRRGSGRRRGT